MSKTSKTRSIIAFTLSVIVIGAAVWLFFNRQYAIDQAMVWSYQPTASIEALDEKVQFTNKGLFTFYATKPVVANSEEFNTKCPRQEAGSPILGCYTPDDRIYVFDVTNEQLEGMKEVTAAHEMLHAVWMRTSDSEKQRLGELLDDAYEKNATPELRERMEYYKRTEPSAITNELHSILGTEVADLGSELDTYYAQYFKNRQLVLDLHANYDTIYKDLNNRAQVLFQEMDTLSDSIQSRSAKYDTDVTQLSSDIGDFNRRAGSGDFDTIAQFNRERAALVARSSQLENERAAINADIASYDVFYQEYETISSQIEVLNNSVDSFKALGETPTVE